MDNTKNKLVFNDHSQQNEQQRERLTSISTTGTAKTSTQDHLLSPDLDRTSTFSLTANWRRTLQQENNIVPNTHNSVDSFWRSVAIHADLRKSLLNGALEEHSVKLLQTQECWMCSNNFSNKLRNRTAKNIQYTQRTPPITSTPHSYMLPKSITILGNFTNCFGNWASRMRNGERSTRTCTAYGCRGLSRRGKLDSRDKGDFTNRASKIPEDPKLAWQPSGLEVSLPLHSMRDSSASWDEVTKPLTGGEDMVTSMVHVIKHTWDTEPHSWDEEAGGLTLPVHHVDLLRPAHTRKDCRQQSTNKL